MINNLKEYMKQYRIDNKYKISAKNKLYYINNRDKRLAYQKQYNINNKEKIKKRSIDNQEEIREYRRQYMTIKRKTDLKYNLSSRMGIQIYKALRKNKNGCPWETLVDYNLDDLIKHLKKTIPKGYNWNDYMKGKLHIDHIIPITAFNFTKPEHIDFKRCWALSNLQLLLAKENRVKHNKLTKPFQPALKIFLGISCNIK